MKKIDTLICPRWLIPVEPHNIYYENYALAIDEGKILAVLPQTEALQQFQANNTIELPNQVLLPGLINAHTHSPMTLFRGLADDLALMEWLNNHIWPAEKQLMNNDFIRDGTELAILEMLKGGTTCINENYFFGEVIADTVQKAKMRALIGITVLEFATPWANTISEYLDKANRLIKSHYKNPHPLVKFAIAPQGPYTVGDAALLKIKAMAEENDLYIHMHMHETAIEITQSMEQFGMRPLQRIHKLGLLSPKFQNIHMTQVNAEDIAILQATGAQVVHCPESNLKLASGICPTQQLLDAGVNIAIGTDGAASNNDLDMLGELRTAALISKVDSNNPTAVPAPIALRMATLNGAKAMGLDQQIGSLEVGKFADVIAIDLSSAATRPIYNPISQIVYAANRDHVTNVWIAGEHIVQAGKVTTLNETNVLTKADAWARQIKNTGKATQS
ncbi:MAG: TRZ/ATZ family hydrolase [Coxiellaceae bacterium]|nr:MAG: TRZ/ATZ family hydrolase [Coxiellaceae bacterium]